MFKQKLFSTIVAVIFALWFCACSNYDEVNSSGWGKDIGQFIIGNYYICKSIEVDETVFLIEFDSHYDELKHLSKNHPQI